MIVTLYIYRTYMGAVKTINISKFLSFSLLLSLFELSIHSSKTMKLRQIVYLLCVTKLRLKRTSPQPHPLAVQGDIIYSKVPWTHLVTEYVRPSNHEEDHNSEGHLSLLNAL